MDWGVSAIISSTASFVFIPFLDYFSNALMNFDSLTISLYNIPIVIGIAGTVFLISYYILSRRNRNKNNDDEKWRFFPANTS